MHYLARPAWQAILLSLALTTVGWLLKLAGYPHAEACIVAGIGLMLLFGALLLWKLTAWVLVGLRGPLAGLLAGLLLSLLASGSLAAAPKLAVVGGVLATGGAAWLLVRLHHTLGQPGRASRNTPLS